MFFQNCHPESIVDGRRIKTCPERSLRILHGIYPEYVEGFRMTKFKEVLDLLCIAELARTILSCCLSSFCRLSRAFYHLRKP